MIQPDFIDLHNIPFRTKPHPFYDKERTILFFLLDDVKTLYIQVKQNEIKSETMDVFEVHRQWLKHLIKI